MIYVKIYVESQKCLLKAFNLTMFGADVERRNIAHLNGDPSENL